MSKVMVENIKKAEEHWSVGNMVYVDNDDNSDGYSDDDRYKNKTSANQSKVKFQYYCTLMKEKSM